MRKRQTKLLAMSLSFVFLFSILYFPVYADQKVIWQQTMNGVYDANLPGFILQFNDELAYGGMDLYTGQMVNSKASADIAYYDKTIAARDIIDLGEVDFDKVDTIPDNGYSPEQKAISNHIYIISTHKGEYAKVKIKSILASSVNIQYAIFKENALDDIQQPSSSDSDGQTSDNSTVPGNVAYDMSIPGTILMYKDELFMGGLDLYTGKMTNSKASADIAINDRTIGARDIIDMGAVNFDSIRTIPQEGYSYEETAAAGHVYIITTHKGEFAKILIKTLMASSVSIKYELLKEDPDQDNNAKRVVYDTSVPGNILVYKSELSQGGMDLSSGTIVKDKSQTDIAFNGSTLAARDIIDMGKVALSKISAVPTNGYSSQVTAVPEHVYIISGHNGNFYKLKVKYVMASSFIFLYDELSDESPVSSGDDSAAGGGGKSDTDLKLDKFNDISLSTNYQEGSAVSVKWNTATESGDESYDIYRSDNGAKFIKVNDLKLGDREYIDEDCKVGRYYLYRIVAFDGNDNVVKVYPLIKANIIKKQTTSKTTPKTTPTTTTKTITMLLNSPKVKVDGKEKTMDSSPVLLNKKVTIPASYLTPLFGMKVVWSAKNGSATITYNKVTAVLRLNSFTATVNNKKTVLEAPLQMSKSKLMVPASLLVKVFSMNIKYTSSNKTIVVILTNKQTGNSSSKDTGSTDKTSSSTGTSGLDYAFKTFILWVPGASYVSGDYDSGINTVYTSTGTLPKSTITVNKDGSYIWNSAWDDKIIKGKWTSNNDGTLNLLSGQQGRTWLLEKSTGKSEDIFILDGFSWYSGKAVSVKKK